MLHLSILYKSFSFRLMWVSIQGTTFKVGCVDCTGQDEEEMPRFALVKEICIVEQSLCNLWLVTERLLTTSFNGHVNAFEVCSTEGVMVLVKQQNLPYGLPLHLIPVEQTGHSKTYVCQKYQLPPI